MMICLPLRSGGGMVTQIRREADQAHALLGAEYLEGLQCAPEIVLDRGNPRYGRSGREAANGGAVAGSTAAWMGHAAVKLTRHYEWKRRATRDAPLRSAVGGAKRDERGGVQFSAEQGALKNSKYQDDGL